MKKSLIIVMIALLVSALFVACNSDVSSTAAGNKAVYAVKIADDNAKGLTGTSTSIIKPVSELYWYYTATKADSSVYSYGATTGQTAIDGDPNIEGNQKGLKGAVLGEFSEGYWTFQFWGYETADSTGNPVYYSDAFTQGVFTNTSLAVELVKGAGIPAGTVTFGSIVSSSYSFENNAVVNLTVKEGETEVSSATGTISNGVASFSLSALTSNPAVGSHTYTFTVSHTVPATANTTQYVETIGENNITVNVQKGVNVEISGSIDKLVKKWTVSVSSSTEPVTPSMVAAPSGLMTVTEDNGTYTVVFTPNQNSNPSYDLSCRYQYNMGNWSDYLTKNNNANGNFTFTNPGNKPCLIELQAFNEGGTITFQHTVNND